MRSFPGLERLQFFVLGFSLLGLAGGCGSNTAGGTNPPPNNPPVVLSLVATPDTVTIFPDNSFFISVTALANGSSAAPTLTLGSLPAGITSSDTFPLTVSSSGVGIIHLATASTVAAGSYTIPIAGSVGTATAQATVSVKVSTGTAATLNLAIPLFNEIGIPQGGTATAQFSAVANSTFSITPSVTGLPSGVSATVNPQVVEPNQSFSITFSATNNAPLTQNTEITLVATGAADVAPASIPLLLDVVSGTPGSANNRTDSVATRATPFSAAYDPGHQLIFSSNQVWNHIDVISNTSHTIVKSIPVRDPRGVDISIDGSTVWVATGSQVMFGINTSTLKATRYLLPRVPPASNNPATGWEGAQVFSLADGTVGLVFSSATGNGSEYVAIWNPANNGFSVLPEACGGSCARWETVTRSADGTLHC